MRNAECEVRNELVLINRIAVLEKCKMYVYKLY